MTRKHSSFCLRSRVVTGGPRARGAHTAEATTRAPPQPRIRGGAGRPHPPPGSLVRSDAGLLPVKFWGLDQPASSVRVKAADGRSPCSLRHRCPTVPLLETPVPGSPRAGLVSGGSQVRGQCVRGLLALFGRFAGQLYGNREKTAQPRDGVLACGLRSSNPGGLRSSNHEDPKRTPAQSPVNVAALTLRVARPAGPPMVRARPAPRTHGLGRATREPYEARAGRAGRDNVWTR